MDRQDGDRGSETILIVEDEEGIRELIRMALEDRGYRVLQAASGGEAISLSAANGQGIDLLLTDMIMPGMSGRELAGRLAESIPGLKVLYVTGNTADPILLEEPGPGHPGFVSKPFSLNLLTRRVREMLDGEA